METIEVSKVQKEVFEGLAKHYNMEVGDFLLKCVKSVRFLIKEWEEDEE